MRTTKISILAYHSISDGNGPTCISPRVFRAHLELLEECKCSVIPLVEVPAFLKTRSDTPSRLVAITFDDAFADFATTAFPELQARGWTATVFLPVAKIGGTNDWQEAHDPARAQPLMTWDTVSDLGHRGIELGSHAMTHTRLTLMPIAAAREEISASRSLIESITGCSVSSFAPPYGKSNRDLREEIRKVYSVSVGTRLAPARADSDLYALPRIEMFYFQNLRLWRAYLQGAASYLAFRKTLRAFRTLATANW